MLRQQSEISRYCKHKIQNLLHIQTAAKRWPVPEKIEEWNTLNNLIPKSTFSERPHDFFAKTKFRQTL